MLSTVFNVFSTVFNEFLLNMFIFRREARAAVENAATLNEKVTEFEALGAAALAEMGGGEQPLAWKRTQPRL